MSEGVRRVYSRIHDVEEFYWVACIRRNMEDMEAIESICGRVKLSAQFVPWVLKNGSLSLEPPPGVAIFGCHLCGLTEKGRDENP